jgi:hypothetical protein
MSKAHKGKGDGHSKVFKRIKLEGSPAFRATGFPYRQNDFMLR